VVLTILELCCYLTSLKVSLFGGGARHGTGVEVETTLIYGIGSLILFFKSFIGLCDWEYSGILGVCSKNGTKC
jgi:hypothetical protein